MIIDLCSGYGGATQAFGEDVVKIDIARNAKPTIQADVRHLPLKPKLKPKLLWLGPPCTYTTFADRKFPRPGIQNNFEIIGACLEAVPYLQPKIWILENSGGRLRWFMPPTYTIEYSTQEHKHKKADLWSNHKSLKRAFIPKEVSQKIYDFIKGIENES